MLATAAEDAVSVSLACHFALYQLRTREGYQASIEAGWDEVDRSLDQPEFRIWIS